MLPGRSICGLSLLLALASVPASGLAQRDNKAPPLPEGARARLGSVELRHGGPVCAAVFLPDGTSVVSIAHRESTVKMHAVDSGRLRRDLKEFGVLGWLPTSMCISPDGKTILVG